MTEKQARILNTALLLFANQGYDATTTKSVAESAGVSEGLIFRHFSNKEGLLFAILEQGREKVTRLFEKVLFQENPEDVIRGVIELPFEIDQEQHHYWRLIYSLKWQTNTYDVAMSVPIRRALEKAFADLGYKNPKLETDVVLLLIDGIATALLLQDIKDTKDLRKTILKKYNL